MFIWLFTCNIRYFYSLSYNHIAELRIKLFSEMKLELNNEDNIEEINRWITKCKELKKEEVKASQEERRKERTEKN